MATNKTSATSVVTGTVRFSYLNVFKPRQIEGSDPKYSACLLIPKSDTKTVTAIKNACEAARMASAALFNGKVPDKLKLPLHDGDGDMPNGGSYGEECHGHWVLNCSSRNKPGLVDRYLNDIIDTTELYSGCYGRADLNFFAFNHQGNRGIGAGLNNLQKIRDGEALGGKSSAKDAFDVVEDEDDDDLGL